MALAGNSHLLHQSGHILGMRVDATSYEEVCAAVSAWGANQSSKYISVATVATVMEAHDRNAFRALINEADLVTPDGMPLVWGLRALGCRESRRVYGPDLTLVLLEKAAAANMPVGFYGASPATLERLLAAVGKRFPNLPVAYAFSPPFRPLTPEEDGRAVDEINRSGARILFVSLSSPKQDYWMAAHRGRIHAVMLGVGAAFDFIAGTKPQAPRWLMRIGMEWFYRLVTEPRRLWKRYLKQNPRFLVFFGLQLLGLRRFRSAA